MGVTDRESPCNEDRVRVLVLLWKLSEENLDYNLKIKIKNECWRQYSTKDFCSMFYNEIPQG